MVRARSCLVLAVVLGLLSAGGVGAGQAGALPTPPRPTVLDFTPVGARTAWLTLGGAGPRSSEAVLRSTDAGSRWIRVAPAGLTPDQASTLQLSDVLSPSRAWLSIGGARPALLTTDDSGQTWRRVGRTPGSCELQFVNARDGWCVQFDGATGNEEVTIYRTTNGGRDWRQVSFTALPGSGVRSTPAAIPFSCDKRIVFTSPLDGFASSACNGGGGYIYATTDGGSRWKPVHIEPPSQSASGGTLFTAVRAHGRDAAAGYTAVGYKAPDLTVVDRSVDGGRTWTAVRPPDPHRPYTVDIVTPQVWRLTAAHTVLATNNAGRTWTRATSSIALGRGQVTFTSATAAWKISPLGRPSWYTADGGRHWTRVRVPR